MRRQFSIFGPLLFLACLVSLISPLVSFVLRVGVTPVLSRRCRSIPIKVSNRSSQSGPQDRAEPQKEIGCTPTPQSGSFKTSPNPLIQALTPNRLRARAGSSATPTETERDWLRRERERERDRKLGDGLGRRRIGGERGGPRWRERDPRIG